ncbi:peptidoglycan editing factor PgeF [Nitrospira sp. KM1]|uniref:peptidoglycan editing factor PgeF n=1 Tax=Nitrospira sp. KM1 TaxID=1936990 RepID=UPI0015669F5C|nr:peptidoglycan editing factor PgeF [Nitrospira sp. KM1]
MPTRTAMGRTKNWLLSVRQVHGTDVLVVDHPIGESDRFEEGWDALITNQPGLTVAVRTADCVPVLVYDRRKRAVAAIHAGWRGAVSGILPKTLDRLSNHFQIERGDLRVSIGPSAGPCCYEVDDAVLNPLRSTFSGWEQVVRNDMGKKTHFDLKAFVRMQLYHYGIEHHHVTSVNLCTICHEELFYSYRREGRVNGTMLSGISLIAQA